MKVKIAELVAKGLVQKRAITHGYNKGSIEQKVVPAHVVDFEMDGAWHCVCCLAKRVEELEALVHALKDHFGASGVIFHCLSPRPKVIIVEVESGTTGDISELGKVHSHSNVGCCGVFPLINGIGMSIHLVSYVKH
jgi:hypothetical protein